MLLLAAPVALVQEKKTDYAPPKDVAFCRATVVSEGPKKLVTIPKITHYGVDREAREKAQKLAIEWYDTHLKGEKKAEDGK